LGENDGVCVEVILEGGLSEVRTEVEMMVCVVVLLEGEQMTNNLYILLNLWAP
jgi:hypothetical protein